MLSTAVLSMDYALGGKLCRKPRPSASKRGKIRNLKNSANVCSCSSKASVDLVLYFDFHVSPKSLEQRGGNLCHCKPFPLRSIEMTPAFQRKILFSLLLLADSLKSTVDDAYT